MSSDLFPFDGSFLRYSPEISATEIDPQFFSDAFPYPDLSLDFLPNVHNYLNQPQISGPNPQAYVSGPAPPLSSSPPCQKMHNLSLNPATSAPAPTQGIVDLGVMDTMGVKIEFNGDLESDNLCRFPDGHNVERAGLMQRSLSSQSLDQKRSFLFMPNFSSLVESPTIQTQMLKLDESPKFEGSMRRASSTGDLHRINRMQSSYGCLSSLAAENSYMDETAAYRVGRYTAEERKQRIHKYRNKRTQRNFNKTIKYACRKTLADSRPRVRGRFARNDETEEIPKATNPPREEEEDEQLWVGGLNEEEELMAMRAFNSGMSPPFQYLGF